MSGGGWKAGRHHTDKGRGGHGPHSRAFVRHGLIRGCTRAARARVPASLFRDHMHVHAGFKVLSLTLAPKASAHALVVPMKCGWERAIATRPLQRSREAGNILTSVRQHNGCWESPSETSGAEPGLVLQEE